jgi:hypothetical protein
METRRMEEHEFPVTDAEALKTKVDSLIDEANLANFTVTRVEDKFQLQLQLKYPAQ